MDRGLPGYRDQIFSEQDIGRSLGAVVQVQSLAGSAEPPLWWDCWGQGLMRSNCPISAIQVHSSILNPDLLASVSYSMCLHCQRRFPWAKDCQSCYAKDVQPLNGQRDEPWPYKSWGEHHNPLPLNDQMGMTSLGAYWTIPLESITKLCIHEKVFKGVADSSADVTILREERIPPSRKPHNGLG